MDPLVYTYTLCIDQEVAWQSQFMHLSEHTYIVCSLIHGVITLSHRDFISLIQTSQRSSLRFDSITR